MSKTKTVLKKGQYKFYLVGDKYRVHVGGRIVGWSDDPVVSAIGKSHAKKRKRRRKAGSGKYKLREFRMTFDATRTGGRMPRIFEVIVQSTDEELTDSDFEDIAVAHMENIGVGGIAYTANRFIQGVDIAQRVLAPIDHRVRSRAGGNFYPKDGKWAKKDSSFEESVYGTAKRKGKTDEE